MGYGPFFVRDIIALKRRGLLDGCRRVVEIGRQQINDRLIVSPELDEVVALFGGTKPELTPVGATHVVPASPPGRLLWSALGLQSKSVDIDGGDIRIDLNKGRVPWRYRGAFDLAINAGTTEHVANQGNAFAAIHDLVRAGGLMVHQLPAYGNIEHGFFGYHPKFFHRLAEANDYEIARAYADAATGIRSARRFTRQRTAAARCQRRSHRCPAPQERPQIRDAGRRLGLVPGGAPAYNGGRRSGRGLKGMR